MFDSMLRRPSKERANRRLVAAGAITAFSGCLPATEYLTADIGGIKKEQVGAMEGPAPQREKKEEVVATGRTQDIPEPLRRFFSGPVKRAVFTPEYAQKNFFMVTGSGTPDAQLLEYKMRMVGGVPHYKERLPGLREFQGEQAAIASAILSASKDTRVTLVVDSNWNCLRCEDQDDGFQRIKKDLQQTAPELFGPAFSGRFKMVQGRGVPAHRFWAQDYGEGVVFDDGSSGFVVGWLPTHKDYGGMRHDIPPLDLTVVNIPVNFDGGNISFATLKGKKLIVASADILEDTHAAFEEEYRYDISEKIVADILRETFGADDVLFLSYPPRRAHGSDIAHIDQAVFFPKDGLAVMQTPAPGKTGMRKAWEEETAQYREQLKAAGFRVIDMPSTPKAAEIFNSYMSYANSIPISDGQKTTIVMPKYGDGKIEWNVWHTMYRNGMAVSFVPDIAYELGGGPHCLVGPLPMEAGR